MIMKPEKLTSTINFTFDGVEVIAEEGQNITGCG